MCTMYQIVSDFTLYVTHYLYQLVVRKTNYVVSCFDQ